jgi:hypothetical protein
MVGGNAAVALEDFSHAGKHRFTLREDFIEILVNGGKGLPGVVDVVFAVLLESDVTPFENFKFVSLIRVKVELGHFDGPPFREA